MSSNFMHSLSEPTHDSSPIQNRPLIEGARAQLRAMLIEGAISPKTTLLNDSFIDQLRQESKKRMGL